MKLIIVGDYYPDIGGVTSYVHTLAKAFLERRLGSKVIIIQTKQHTKFHVIVSKRVTIYRIPYNIADRIRLSFRGLRYVYTLIKSFPLLVIQPRSLLSAIIMASMMDGVIASECSRDQCVMHSNHLSLRSLVALLVGKKSGVRVIVTAHGYDASYPISLIEYMLRKTVVDMATKIIVLTQIKRTLLKLLYKNDEKFVVIPNFVECREVMNNIDINYEKHETKRVRGLGNQFVIGYVGRILSEKGVFDILEAIHRIEEEVRTNLSVLFIGEGPDEMELRNLVDKKGLRRKTVLLGPLVGERKTLWIKAMDIMVLPTRLPETFPTIILEAWSHGVIPVVYPFLGADEIIKENLGYIVQNVDELARVIERLIKNPGLLETLRTSIIENLRNSNYCVENAIRRIESLYKDCDEA